MDLSYLKYKINNHENMFSWSWQEILFGLENKILENIDIIKYAVKIFDEGIIGYDIVLDVTSLNYDEEVYPYLRKIVELEKSEDINEIKSKWLYVILDWLYENKNKYEDVLSVVEEIYDDFRFPFEISSFVRYMPSENGNLGSISLNRAKLYDNWKKYLETQKEKYRIE